MILFESVLIFALSSVIGLPWLVLPYIVIRLFIGQAEDAANAQIASAAPGDTGSFFGGIVTILIVAIPGVVILLALLAVGVGGAL